MTTSMALGSLAHRAVASALVCVAFKPVRRRRAVVAVDQGLNELPLFALLVIHGALAFSILLAPGPKFIGVVAAEETIFQPRFPILSTSPTD